MTFGKQLWQALGAVALGVVVSTSAIGQVVTRLVVAGGSATTATIAPGGTVSIDVRLDVGTLGVGCFGGPPCAAGATGLTGTAFRLSQTLPAANGFFSITGRSFAGSPFNDTSSGTPDTTVLAAPSNLLDPDNNDNLGRTTVGLVATPPAANTLAVNLTLTASASTPPGTYTIQPTAGVSFATDDAFNDYSMSGGTFTIVVAAAVLPPTIAKSFGAPSIPLNGSTALSFTITNPNPAATALTGIGFTDTLPAGLVVSTPNGLTGTCGGGTITAAAGSGSVSLTGATLAGGANCTFSVNVTGTTSGAKNNVTGAVTSVEGGNGNTASASVSVGAAILPPSITKSFAPASIVIGGSSTLSFTITNPNAATALTGVSVTDALPGSLVVSTPNALTGTCGAGTITAVAGSASVSLTGGTLPAAGSCTFSVSVTAPTSGTKTNVTGAVSSTEGGTGGTATATLTVAGISAPSFSKSFGQSAIPPLGSTSLTFTITNANASTTLTGIGFTDTLPAGLVVSTPNGLTGTCGAGAISAVAGSGTVSLTGASLAANTSCTFTVNVTATSNGTKTNVTSTITSVEGGAGNAATAVLTVGVLVPVPTLQQWALWMLSLMMLIVTAFLFRARRKSRVEGLERGTSAA